MEKIIKWEFDQNVPFYIPCFFPLLNEKLKLKGYKSDLELLNATALIGIPALSKSIDSEKLEIDYWSALDLDYKFCSEYLNIELFDKEFTSMEEGLRYLESNVDGKNLSIVYGTPYHLPYSVHYHSPNFTEVYGKELGVYDHAIAVYGKDKDNVYVYDTTPVLRLEKVDFEDFAKYWYGNGHIPGFEGIAKEKGMRTYGYLEVEIHSYPTEEEKKILIERGLKTVAFEYLQGKEVKENGKHTICGYKQIDYLVNELRAASLIDDKEKVSKMIQLVFRLKFNRFFIRDIILYMVNSGDSDPIYQEFYEECMDVINEFEKMSFHYCKKYRKKGLTEEDIEELASVLNEIKTKEISFNTKYRDYASTINLFEKE